MDEDDRVAPSKIIEMGLQVRFGCGGFEVCTTFLERQSCIE
jgi:hypothetical protein